MMRLNRLLIPVVLAAVVGLAGCASSANRAAMVPGDLKPAKQHAHSVAVKTSGGSPTGAMDSSNISDEDLKAAIEDSIVQNKVFNSVVQGKAADYDLMVSIVHLNKPMFGLSFTVELEATWVLVKQSDRSVVFKRSVKSSHTATFSDAAVAITRLRLALEGAARNNIEQGLTAISALSL
ncbi:MAG: hypothetical protein Q7J47_09480 [Azoarcus sp.]|nr:hypothetical protein [Azoarcus sp.]